MVDISLVKADNYVIAKDRWLLEKNKKKVP